MRVISHVLVAVFAWLLSAMTVSAVEPVRVIYDTDLGGDIDDALALAVIHALETRGECRLLAITLSEHFRRNAAFADVLNTFYGRPDIPIGLVREDPQAEASRYAGKVADAQDGAAPRYPHDLVEETPQDAVELLRSTLAAQPDGSVVMVMVGPSTNVARFLESPGDAHSPQTGRELAAQKCKLLSLMAGMFSPVGRKKEWNVYQDLDASRKVWAQWPTPIVASGSEIGEAITYPGATLPGDCRYVTHHPVREAYESWGKMPYDRPAWDLTSVLIAVRPDRGYFGLSDPGTIHVDDHSVTQFTTTPAGRHRYLTATAQQIAQVREALVQLVSQPPAAQRP